MMIKIPKWYTFYDQYLSEIWLLSQINHFHSFFVSHFGVFTVSQISDSLISVLCRKIYFRFEILAVFLFFQSLKIVWASLAPISRFGPNGLIGQNALILVPKRIKVRLWVTEPVNVQVPSVNLKWWNKQGHVQNALVGLPGQRTSLIALTIYKFM